MLSLLPPELLDKVLEWALLLEAHGPSIVFLYGRASTLPEFAAALENTFRAKRWCQAVARARAALHMNIPGTTKGDVRDFHFVRTWAQTLLAEGTLGVFVGDNQTSICINSYRAQNNFYSIPNEEFQKDAAAVWNAWGYMNVAANPTGSLILFVVRGKIWRGRREGKTYILQRISFLGQAAGLDESLYMFRARLTVTDVASVIAHQQSVLVLHHGGDNFKKVFFFPSYVLQVATHTTEAGSLILAVAYEKPPTYLRYSIVTIPKTPDKRSTQKELVAGSQLYGELQKLVVDDKCITSIHTRCICRLFFDNRGNSRHFYTQLMHGSFSERVRHFALESWTEYGEFAYAIAIAGPRSELGFADCFQKAMGLCLNKNGRVLFTFPIPHETHKIRAVERGILCARSSSAGRPDFLYFTSLMPWLSCE